MRLTEKIRDLLITKRLRMGKNSVLEQVDADGTVNTIALAELRNLLDYSSATESLTAATTLTADDHGKTFFLNLAGGFTTTLPAPAAGLKFKFVVATAPTTAYVIVTEDGDDIMIGGINELEVDTADDGPYDANADTFNFVANVAVVGDWVEFVSDGTSWFFTGQTNADGGVTTSTT